VRSFFSYDTPVFRPPSEGQSLLLQVTLGCSNNHCTYCGMYRTKKYQVRDLTILKEEIDLAAKQLAFNPHFSQKAFLCDGDALGADTHLLLETLNYLNFKFPHLRQVGIYATAENMLGKSDSDLKLLAEKKLTLSYLGMESGDDEVLKLVVKGNSSEDMVKGVKKLKQAGIDTSVIAMLGLGGRQLSAQHVKNTAAAILQMQPKYFSFLTTTVVPGTPYEKQVERGQVCLLSTRELLKEMHDILWPLKALEKKVIFRANHVSNMFPLGGTLPNDLEKILFTINSWIQSCPVDHYPTIDPSML